MILAVCVVLKEIHEKGRNYFWPRPKFCPCCGFGKLWGHGFVSSYFDGFSESIFLKRYRCVDCRSVIRLKPREYFPKFQSSIPVIRESIDQRINGEGVQGGPSRSRVSHWVKALKRKALAYLGVGMEKDLLKAFDVLLEMGKVPVSRSI